MIENNRMKDIILQLFRIIKRLCLVRKLKIKTVLEYYTNLSEDEIERLLTEENDKNGKLIAY